MVMVSKTIGSSTDGWNLTTGRNGVAHGFGVSGALLAYPVNQAVLAYGDEGERLGMVFHDGVTNLVKVTDAPKADTVSQGWAEDAGAQFPGLVNSIKLKRRTDINSNSTCYKRVDYESGEYYHLHLLTKVEGGARLPVLSQVTEGSDAMVMMAHNSAGVEEVYRRVMPGNVLYSIHRYRVPESVTDANNYFGVSKRPLTNEEPLIVVVLQVTKGRGWAPVICVTTGAIKTLPSTVLVVASDKMIPVTEKPFKFHARGRVYSVANTALGVDGLGAMVGMTHGTDNNRRIAIGSRNTGLGLSDWRYGQAFGNGNSWATSATTGGYRTYTYDEEVTFSVDIRENAAVFDWGDFKLPSADRDFLTGAGRNRITGGYGVASGRILNCCVSELVLTAK